MKQLIMSFLAKAGMSVTGPIGWLVSLIVDRFFVFAQRQISLWVGSIKEKLRKKNEEKVDDKNEAAYNEVTKPDSAPTEQELEGATSDLLNGRRK
jgi:hypothetical protein